jgi:hypothetical protein
MTWPERRIKSWSELLKIFEEIDETNPVEFCFRGQSDAEWPLEPTLSRLIRECDFPNCRYIENNILSTFKRRAKLLLEIKFPPDKDTLNWWSIMQHYKAPTRLLDWTLSPYVALYFAVIENLQRDGAIWAFNSHLLFDAFPRNEYKIPLIDFLCARAEEEDIFIQYAVMPYKQPIQQVLFSYCSKLTADHSSVIDKLFCSQNRKDYYKIIISSDLKSEFLHQLRVANITASSLFPGIDGLGLSVTEEFLRTFRRLKRLSV